MITFFSLLFRIIGSQRQAVTRWVRYSAGQMREIKGLSVLHCS